ncbi:MAG: DUF2934 domain-containing protein [Chlorobiaceae bacterium]|nr:DUF2934 domain-containing protein [Chlorobiaceae bacterium]
MAKGSKKAKEAETDLHEEEVTVPEQQTEEIRLAAYYLWEKKGKNHGSDVEDWIEAEDTVND